jgi:hypothetical protein
MSSLIDKIIKIILKQYLEEGQHPLMYRKQAHKAKKRTDHGWIIGSIKGLP